MKQCIPVIVLLVMIGTSMCFGEDKSRAALLSETISFVNRRVQKYNLRYTSTPDQKRFLIDRQPTTQWPEKENFIIGIGDTSSDKQIRVDGFVKKVAKTDKGILIDASVLTVTHLPSGAKYQLVRTVPVTIPTFFAELQEVKRPGKSFYVKEGDTFVLPSSAADPKAGNSRKKYQVTKVTKESVFIALAGTKDAPAPVEIKRK